MITHEEAKEALWILYFNIYEVDEEEYQRINKIANIVLDYIKQQSENEIEDEIERSYHFEYKYVSKNLKNGFHIRAFYGWAGPTYILYYKTTEFYNITNRCFNRLIPNLEHRPSGRPCEECYVWKD